MKVLRAQVVALIASFIMAGAVTSAVGKVRAQEESIDGWEILAGGFSTVTDLALVAEDDIWAATYEGIAHYDGSRWRLESPGGSTGISIAPDGAGWVAATPYLLQKHGDAWSAAEGDWTGHVFDVGVLGAGRGWAVAASVLDDLPATRLLHLTNNGWVETDHVIGGIYDSMEVLGEADVWLVGSRGIAHFDGATLARLPIAVPAPLLDLSFSDPQHGWAVGGGCPEYSSVAYSYDGNTWSQVPLDPEQIRGPLQSVTALPSGEAVAGSYHGDVVRLTGGSTARVLEVVDRAEGNSCVGGFVSGAWDAGRDQLLLGGSSITGAFVYSLVDDEITLQHGHRFNSLALTSADGGWLTWGSLYRVDRRGVAARISAPGVPEKVEDVLYSQSGVTWLAGKDDGEAVVSLRENGAWEMRALGSSGTAFQIEESPGGSMWVGGTRVIDGEPEAFVQSARPGESAWREGLVAPGYILDMSAGAGDHVLVLTENQTIHRRFRGQWTVASMPETAFVHGVAATRDSGWAVGEGVMYRLEEGSWVPESRLDGDLAPVLEYLWLEAVYVSDEQEAWAVGADGNVLEFQDGLWRFARKRGRLDGWTQGGGLRSLLAVDSFRIDDETLAVWAVGESGTIIRREIERPPAGPTPTQSPTAIGVLYVPWIYR